MNTLLRKSVTIMQSITAGAVALLLPSMAQAVDAKFAQFCEHYATEALEIRGKMESLGCDVSANARFGDGRVYGTLFDPSRKAHFDWCLTKDGDFTPPTGEALKRWLAFKECKDKAAAQAPQRPVKQIGPRTMTCTIDQAVDVCPTTKGCDENTRIGVLELPGTTVTVFGRFNDDGVKDAQGAWHKVKVPAGEGFAFSGEDFVSLKCPG